MSNSDINKKISEIASNWWTKVIVNPKMDNGDRSLEGMFINKLMSLAAEKDIDSKNLEIFNRKLQEYIFERIDNEENEFYSLILDVDYSPGGILRKLAEECNINKNNFPIKTTMWISQNHCSVRYGYGANEEILFATDDYFKHKIKDCEANIDYYKNKDNDYFGAFSREEILEEQDEILESWKKEREEWRSKNAI